MSSRSIARWGAVLAAPVLAVSAGLSPASATATYTVPLHQTPPITAAGFDGHEAKCADIPSSQDGWHFVLTGNSTEFVKLTVTFQPGGQVVVTKFGPPTDKHAYVASAPGATLVSASAEVMGGEVPWFNLSHTCPASEKPPTTPPTTQPPTTQPPTTQPPTTAPPTTKPATTPPATGGTTPPPSETPSGTPSASESATVSPTSSPSASTGGSSGGGGGSLAQTGGIAVGGILAVSAALVVGGYYIRRRTAGGNTSA